MKFNVHAAVAAASLFGLVVPMVWADSGHMGHMDATNASGHAHGAEEGNVRTNDNVIDIYGRLYMSVVTNDYNTSSVERETLLTSHGSVLGVRGHKPISSATKLFWQIESDVDLDNMGSGGHDGGGNGSELASSDSFVGFSGTAGALLAGKHKTPFTLAVHQWDPFMHVAGDATGTFGHLTHYSSLIDDEHDTIYHVSAPNSIVYFSPDLSGFSLNVAVLAVDRIDREAFTGTEVSREKSRISGSSMSLNYHSGGLSLVYAFETHRELEWQSETAHDVDECDADGADDVAGNADDMPCYLIDRSRAQILGIMYQFSSTMVSAVVESLKVEDAVIGNNDRLAYRLVLKQNVGPHSLRLAFTQAGEFDQKDGGSTVAAGWFQSLSSTTAAYVNAVLVKNDDEGSFGTFTTGDVPHGADPTTFALGVIHSF